MRVVAASLMSPSCESSTVAPSRHDRKRGLLVNRKRMVLMGTAAVAIAATAGIAVAGGTGDDDKPLTGSNLQRATAAALAHTGGGTITETEIGDDGAAYGVEVRLEDGRRSRST